MKKAFCMNCDEEKGYRVIESVKDFAVKDTVVKAKVFECFCNDCGYKLFVYEYEKKNQISIYDAYKEKMGLMTSVEIIQLRKKYGLSQRALANIIQCGEKNIARYENGAIQDQSINLLLKLVDRFPEYFGLTPKDDVYHANSELKTTYNESTEPKYNNSIVGSPFSTGGIVKPC